ncbi:MAG: glycosyltransferase [Candidatus Omnitrophica bacterium]|nr:glycosyltransferase [Candidatus Omnitrophota bacterium]
MDPIAISVIIPAYNASATIGRTLFALTSQDYAGGFEVIVVDDGSLDNTANIVASFPAVRYVRQENAGPASARNHGARLAKGEYFAFTDSDCVPNKDWISQLIKGFEQNQVGVVAGSYGIANPKSILAGCVWAEIVWRHSHLMPDFPKAFGSYNFCVKKNVFEAVKGFNTGYRMASGEDNDLSYKIIKAGWLIYFQRKAVVDHYHPTEVNRYLKEQFRHGFWRVKMYRDHPRMMRGDGYTYWKDIIEMPWAGGIGVGIVLSVLNFGGFKHLTCFLLLSFLVFEILSAFLITRRFFRGIFFGFILFLRAFARMFGFSSGFFSISLKK